MGNPLKMDDVEVPPFQETAKYCLNHPILLSLPGVGSMPSLVPSTGQLHGQFHGLSVHSFSQRETRAFPRLVVAHMLHLWDIDLHVADF